MGALPPELKILILNAAGLAVAYLGIYPSMARITLRRLLRQDVVLSVVLLGVAGVMFAGTGTRFSLVVFDTPWWVFTLLTAMVMEWPLFRWFCRRHAIDPFSEDAWHDDD
ncbi:hypothetical protein [Salibaculum halophilum]|uniref:hypothetical protein n=1 Tax=Salibaculum halophilum TaxID=1914408 RepID=UPI000A0F41BB|nr:hypothetical protein [Salibaculum halophilum]